MKAIYRISTFNLKQLTIYLTNLFVQINNQNPKIMMMKLNSPEPKIDNLSVKSITIPIYILINITLYITVTPFTIYILIKFILKLNTVTSTSSN